MKISVLIEREPFEKIFEETLASFLYDYTNLPHTVKWHTKNHDYQNTTSLQKWYCNPLINSIFIKNVGPQGFNSIKGEYVSNPLKPWQTPFQKLYFTLATSRPSASFFSKYIISIKPHIKGATNKLIIGGNTKIRIIDLHARNVYVILKNGFDNKYIEREINARLNISDVPIPELLSVDDGGSWYCEQYVSGIPPNRTGKRTEQVILEKAIGCLKNVLTKTQQIIQVQEYGNSLHESIITNLHQIAYLDQNTKDQILSLASKLIVTLKKYNSLTITTSFCHGDFHQGNILTDGDKFWILDWEFSGRKQSGYDLFILLLKSRITYGFSRRFYRLVSNNLDGNERKLIDRWPGVTWSDSQWKQLHLFLFLLEELDFYICENNNRLFYNETQTILTRYYEIEACAAMLI